MPVLSANVSHKNLFNGTSSNVELLVNTATDDYLDVPDHWFHNGVLLPTTARTTILTQQAKLTLDNPFTLDIGVYETQLRINTHSKLTCDNPSPYTGFMGTSTAIIRSDVQQLLYYGNCVQLRFDAVHIKIYLIQKLHLLSSQLRAAHSQLPTPLH